MDAITGTSACVLIACTSVLDTISGVPFDEEYYSSQMRQSVSAWEEWPNRSSAVPQDVLECLSRRDAYSKLILHVENHIAREVDKARLARQLRKFPAPSAAIFVVPEATVCEQDDNTEHVCFCFCVLRTHDGYICVDSHSHQRKEDEEKLGPVIYHAESAEELVEYLYKSGGLFELLKASTCQMDTTLVMNMIDFVNGNADLTRMKKVAPLYPKLLPGDYPKYEPCLLFHILLAGAKIHDCQEHMRETLPDSDSEKLVVAWLESCVAKANAKSSDVARSHHGNTSYALGLYRFMVQLRCWTKKAPAEDSAPVHCSNRRGKQIKYFRAQDPYIGLRLLKKALAREFPGGEPQKINNGYESVNFQKKTDIGFDMESCLCKEVRM